MLKKSKEAYNQDSLPSARDRDIESSTVGEVAMSPLSIVHVRHDYEVTNGTANLDENDGKACKHQTSFN
jgi:hypothetical protein